MFSFQPFQPLVQLYVVNGVVIALREEKLSLAERTCCNISSFMNYMSFQLTSDEVCMTHPDFDTVSCVSITRWTIGMSAPGIL